MARTFGAIYVRIWRDKDFRSLSHTEQYLYMALISQAKLNRAGLLEYSPRRWAEATDDLTLEDVEITLKRLEQRKYIVLDEAANELLIRTFVRNDEAWKQPKMMASVVAAADEIDSPKLRRALLKELDRIPVSELSDKPTDSGGPSIRARIERSIGQMRALLDDGEPDEPERLPLPSPRSADADVSATFGPNVADVTPISGRSVTPGLRARAGAGPEPRPEPEPQPCAALATSGGAQLSLVPDLAPDEPAPHTPKPETEGQRINRLARIYTDKVPLSKFLAVQAIVRAAVQAKSVNEQPMYTDEQISDGLLKLIAEDRSVTKDALRIAIHGAPKPSPMPTYQNPKSNAGYVGGWRRPNSA